MRREGEWRRINIIYQIFPLFTLFLSSSHRTSIRVWRDDAAGLAVARAASCLLADRRHITGVGTTPHAPSVPSVVMSAPLFESAVSGAVLYIGQTADETLAAVQQALPQVQLTFIAHDQQNSQRHDRGQEGRGCEYDGGL